MWETELCILETQKKDGERSQCTLTGGQIPGFQRLLKFTFLFFFPNIQNVPTYTGVFNTKKQAVLEAEVSSFTLMFRPMKARRMQGHIDVPSY